MLQVGQHCGVKQIGDVQNHDPPHGGQEGETEQLKRWEDGPGELDGGNKIALQLQRQVAAAIIQGRCGNEEKSEPDGGGDELVDGELRNQIDGGGLDGKEEFEIVVEVMEHWGGEQKTDEEEGEETREVVGGRGLERLGK